MRFLSYSLLCIVGVTASRSGLNTDDDDIYMHGDDDGTDDSSKNSNKLPSRIEPEKSGPAIPELDYFDKLSHKLLGSQFGSIAVTSLKTAVGNFLTASAGKRMVGGADAEASLVGFTEDLREYATSGKDIPRMVRRKIYALYPFASVIEGYLAWKMLSLDKEKFIHNVDNARNILRLTTPSDIARARRNFQLD